MHDPRSLLFVAPFFLLAACGGGTGERANQTTEDRDGVVPKDPAVADRAEDSAADESTSGLPVLSGVATLEPVDEGASDTGLARFRDELLQAIARRDTAYVLSVVSPDIRNTFGDDNGRAAFRRRWRLGESDSELWAVLERVLRGGGRFHTASGNRSFMAPYVYAAWPGEFDAFQHVATTTDDAIARAWPESSAPALGVLPYRIVRIGWPPSESEAADGWTEIELADERRAWIASSDVYSPVGYRAIFQERDGRWLMNALIAGD